MSGTRNFGGQARGEPWQIMYVNVINHLLRTTMLFPLRLTLKDIAEPCYPQALFEKGPQWDNVRSALNFSAHVQFIIGDQPFWYEYSPTEGTVWPTPANNSTAIMIDRDHPHRLTILNWIHQASAHDEFLGESRMYLNRLFKVLKHPDWVKKHWSRIHPYIGKLPKATTRGLREPINRQVQMDLELNDKIEQMLTAAALLPKDATNHTWVGFYTERAR